MTGFKSLEDVDWPGRNGVKTFKKRQSSSPYRADWAHGDPKLRAEIVGDPV
jgi:hypothetical protein